MIDPFSTATELAAAIRKKEVSSLELTDLYIDRVERYDERTNAVVVRDFERGREAARAADEALARGDDTGPLHGVPMTVKEAYDVAGLTALEAGLPIGLQAVSGEYRDYTTIEFARLMAEEIGGFTPPPDFP